MSVCVADSTLMPWQSGMVLWQWHGVKTAIDLWARIGLQRGLIGQHEA